MISLAGALVTLIAAGAAAPAADAALGTVTVRFKNTTKHDVFIDASFGDGVSWPFPTRWDGSLCKEDGACEGLSMPRPLPRARIVPAGGIVESSWDGGYFDIRSCANGPNYRCATRKRAAPGSYKVRLEGARAYQQAAAAVGTPEGGFVDGVEPDMSKGACRAEAAFTLDATVKTVDAQVVCDPAK